MQCNYLGEGGACAFARALRTNCSLTELYLDVRNSVVLLDGVKGEATGCASRDNGSVR